jgi:hypothetical protein
MYRKPQFLQTLHEVRQRMSRECDYDIDLFVQKLQMAHAEDGLQARETLSSGEKKSRGRQRVRRKTQKQ